MGREHRFGTGIAQGTIPSGVPGFLSRCSWMFPEQLRNKSELVGSEEIHETWTKHPKYVTPSGWTLWKFFYWLCLQSLQKLGRCTLEPILDWVLLVFSGVSLETAANFLLFLKVTMILREKFCQLTRLNWILIIQKRWISRLIMRERFQSEANSYCFQEN